MSSSKQDQKLNKHVKIMVFTVIGMFGFGFAMVPIYNVFCDVTGLNGKTGGQVRYKQGAIDKSRTVTVELLATLNEQMPGEFAAKHTRFTLHPGELAETAYWVKNLTDKPMVVQAIPSVSPGLAAKHIKKIECFCFKKQPLVTAEGKYMPLQFTIDPMLPKEIQTITLAYTLFDITQG